MIARGCGGWSGLLLGIGGLLGCAGQPPETLGPVDGALAPCPTTPNCVNSQHGGDIAPLTLALPAAEAWPRIRDAVAALPRTTVVIATDGYLHAQARSRLLGFVDDLELLLQAERGLLQLRSASRLGYSDLGVNRDRIETLTRRLIEAGVAEPTIAGQS